MTYIKTFWGCGCNLLVGLCFNFLFWICSSAAGNSLYILIKDTMKGCKIEKLQFNSFSTFSNVNRFYDIESAFSLTKVFVENSVNQSVCSSRAEDVGWFYFVVHAIYSIPATWFKGLALVCYNTGVCDVTVTKGNFPNRTSTTVKGVSIKKKLRVLKAKTPSPLHYFACILETPLPVGLRAYLMYAP